MPPHRQPRTTSHDSYAGQQMYVGDLHNHCGISYGHGTIEDAFANARLQLDFGTVTGHAWWPDMPVDVPEAAASVRYHQEGFARLADCWDHVQQVTADNHVDGEFVSFLSFEWHCSQYGDHCVYFNGDRGEIIRADDLDGMRAELRSLAEQGTRTMVLPHHIGYLQGRRGANWDAWTPEFSPLVEMMSMHGCGESDDAPRPYLHTMGPRHTDNTAIAGFLRGLRFGIIGSTDHHSAHPGSFGHGRVAAWATGLTRDELWEAFHARRTYAVTGDPINVAFAVNDVPMGGEAETAGPRHVTAAVAAEAPIDYVEVVRNGVPLHRVSRSDLPTTTHRDEFRGVVPFNLGWAHPDTLTRWDVELEVSGGRLVDVVPRLRGEDIVAPSADAPSEYHFSSWQRSDHGVRLQTVTHGNANVVTDNTQGLNLHLVGDDRTVITAVVNGQRVEHRLGELRDGSAEHYLTSIVSPVFRFGRAVADAELIATLDVVDDTPQGPGFGSHGRPGDFYHLRVRQTNDQWAWTSPVWVDAPA